MPSHKLHIKWEKKLGLPTDKKLHEIVDNLAHHDAIGVKTVNPHTPYLPFIKDLPKRIAERFTTVLSGLHCVFEELRKQYDFYHLPVEVHKRVALHLILDGIADVIQKDLGLKGLEKTTPEEIVEMGHRRMYEKMYKRGISTIRDAEEDLFFRIAGEMVKTLKEHSSEIVKDIVEELKAKGKLRLVGYRQAYREVSKAMRELEHYLNYPAAPGFNLEVLIRQIASRLSKGVETEVPILWRKGNQKGCEILKVKSLDEFLQKLEEFKRKRLGLK